MLHENPGTPGVYKRVTEIPSENSLVYGFQLSGSMAYHETDTRFYGCCTDNAEESTSGRNFFQPEYFLDNVSDFLESSGILYSDTHALQCRELVFGTVGIQPEKIQEIPDKITLVFRKDTVYPVCGADAVCAGMCAEFTDISEMCFCRRCWNLALSDSTVYSGSILDGDILSPVLYKSACCSGAVSGKSGDSSFKSCQTFRENSGRAVPENFSDSVCWRNTPQNPHHADFVSANPNTGIFSGISAESLTFSEIYAIIRKNPSDAEQSDTST